MRGAKPGEVLEITGCTIVDGVSVDILLQINTVQLIHKLGGKAVLNRSRKARGFSGLVVATADKERSQAIREARALKHAARRHRDEEARKAWLASLKDDDKE